MCFINDNSVNWNWMRNAGVPTSGKQNTAAVTPEQTCVPRSLFRQHLTRYSIRASCAPVERRKAREGEEQDKDVPPCWCSAGHFCPQCGQFTGVRK